MGLRLRNEAHVSALENFFCEVWNDAGIRFWRVHAGECDPLVHSDVFHSVPAECCDHLDTKRSAFSGRTGTWAANLGTWRAGCQGHDRGHYWTSWSEILSCGADLCSVDSGFQSHGTLSPLHKSYIGH